jgi:hypothetical protein
MRPCKLASCAPSPSASRPPFVFFSQANWPRLRAASALVSPTLPWLLAGLAEAAVPAIRKKGASILERK